MANFYRRVGELILGTRLKRISDKFLTDVSKIYKKLNIPFEVSWFPIFYLLNEKGKLSVTDLARELEITHSAVSQMINLLDKKGLIKFIEDETDKRRRFISFTQKGQELMSTLPPIWNAMQHSVQEIFSEGINSTHILSALDEIEESLEKENLTSRVIKEVEKSSLNTIVIDEYNNSYYNSYKNFILDWFIENNDMSEVEQDLINNPQKAVDELNTSILIAKEGDQCVGVIVFRKGEDKEVNIIFFVVSEKFKKNLIGKRLLSEMFNRLNSGGIRTISITISRNSSELIRILKDTGFKLHAIDNTINKQANSTHIIMQYDV